VKVKYEKSDAGRLLTDCTIHAGVMVGSIWCEKYCGSCQLLDNKAMFVKCSHVKGYTIYGKKI